MGDLTHNKIHLHWVLLLQKMSWRREREGEKRWTQLIETNKKVWDYKYKATWWQHFTHTFQTNNVH